MTSRPASPYKGLNAFEDSELDALLFFGRERETAIVVANLIASRLTVLYGPSGVGKSSLLSAAVARSLRDLPENPLVVVFSQWSADPATALTEVVADAADSSNASLLDAIEGAQAGRDVYLVFDQAEEYFLYHAEDAGPGSFAETLPTLVSAPLRVNILISLRDDSLARLDRFTGRIPGLFANTLRLDRLDRQAARAAILRPAERYSELVGEVVTVEPQLVDLVLDEVGAGQIESSLGGVGVVDSLDDDTRVEAPYLQLVMQRLWEEESGAGSRALRAETFERLGGAQHIVEEHLEGAMADLTSAQKDVAARIFNHLVTPSGTKIAHEAADLADFGRVSETDLVPVLTRLSERRILRSVDEGGTTRYEIFHDVLGEPVLAWRTRHRTEREIARNLEESHRRRRRLQALFALVLIALGLMTALAAYAVIQRDDAQTESRRAKGRELAANAVAELTTDPQLSVLLASEAARLAPSTEIEDVLRRSLEASKLRLVVPAGGPASSARYSPDGSRVVVTGEKGRGRVVDAVTGDVGAELRHEGAIHEAWFAPDGGTVLTASEDGTARIWDAESGTELRALDHGGAVTTARFAANGSSVITAGGRMARLWNATTGQLERNFAHSGPLLSAVLSPDGRLVATVSDRGDTRVTARVFDRRTGRQLYSPDQFGVTSVGFSPDGKLVLTTSTDRTARLWRARDGEPGHTFDQEDGHVVGASFSPDGTQLVTASDGGTARVWDIATGGRLLVLVGPTNPVESAEFSPDGRFIVLASLDRTARIYRVDNGLQASVLLGHTEGVTSAVFSPDGRRVVTASDDATARVWDPGTADALELVGDHESAVTAAALSPDGRLAVSADAAGGVRLWDVERKRAQWSDGLPGPLWTVAFSPDGSRVAAGGHGDLDDRAFVWDVASGERIASFAHEDSPGAVEFTADGARLLAAGGRFVRVWSVGDEEVVRDIRTTSVVTADVDGAGALIASAGLDGVARIWDARTSDLVHELEGHEDGILDVAFDQDARRLVTAGADDTARIWDVDSGQPLHALEGHLDDISDAAFAADGSRVGLASLDGDGSLWDVESGRQLHRLRGHFNPVFAIAFDPSGRWIVTGSQRTAGLWPVSSGLLSTYLRGHVLPVTSVSFSQSGWRVLTASEDGTVRTWVCETCGEIPELLMLAGARLAATGRDLTDDERARFVD